MADRLEVDPVELHLVGNHLLAAADDHATATRRHEEDLNEAASRWRGRSRAALQELAEHWETQHVEHQQRVTALGEAAAAAGAAFAAMEDRSNTTGESGSAVGSAPASSLPPGAAL